MKLRKKLADKLAKIEQRRPILDVLESDGVKAAYEENRKRKRALEEEERAAKKQKNEQVERSIVRNVLRSSVLT